jgi:hypothetical protein
MVRSRYQGVVPNSRMLFKVADAKKFLLIPELVEVLVF